MSLWYSDDLRESWNDDLPEPEAISFKGALLIPVHILSFNFSISVHHYW